MLQNHPLNRRRTLLGFSKSENSVFWGSVLLGLAWILFRLFNNEGWILDDEATHYIFSKSVWVNDDQLFNHWTRPGRNFVHCLAAPFGFTATRLYTLALAFVSVWITVLVGKKLEVRALWIVPLMLIFQSWFPELSYPVLTQTPFMLFWILGVWLALKGRYHLAALSFGYLSLIRHEGIVLTALWGIWLSFQSGGFLNKCWISLRERRFENGLWTSLGRDSLYGVSTVAPIVIYNVLALTLHGSFPFGVYFESEPTTMYGSGAIYHYVPLLLAGVGYVTAVFALLGLWGVRKVKGPWSLLLVTYLTYFVLHSVVFWRGAFASGGYYHFLMPMAPFVALLAAEGFAKVRDRFKKRQTVFSIAVVALVLFQGFHMNHHQNCYQDWVGIKRGEAEFRYTLLAQPIVQGEVCEDIEQALEWIQHEYPKDRPIVGKHISVKFELDQAASKEQQNLEFSPLYKMPLGTLYVWDHIYCEQENRIKFASFSESSDWKAVKHFEKNYPPAQLENACDAYSVIVFEKVASDDLEDKVYNELGEADKYNSIYK
jgi:hypothetical protein